MPKISVNKLAELLVTANPTRRRRIVHDQKFPSPAVVPLYRGAYAPIAEYLTKGAADFSPIDKAITRLRSDRSGTQWAIGDRERTADALEHFIQLAPQLPRDGVTYSATENEQPKLYVAGVDISVRPEFLLRIETRGRRYSGAMKLHFISNEESALQKSGSQYVATMLHRWLQEHGPQGHSVRPNMCLSIDVFRRSVVASPSSTSRRWDEITAACEEVAARWPSL